MKYLFEKKTWKHASRNRAKVTKGKEKRNRGTSKTKIGNGSGATFFYSFLIYFILFLFILFFDRCCSDAERRRPGFRRRRLRFGPLVADADAGVAAPPTDVDRRRRRSRRPVTAQVRRPFFFLLSFCWYSFSFMFGFSCYLIDWSYSIP